MTTAAIDNFRAWVDRVFAEDLSDSRLKASLIAEALDRYRITPIVAARALALDAQSFTAFLSQRIAPGETFTFETENGLESAPYLPFAKMLRQLRALKANLQYQFVGAMGDEWLTHLMALRLAQNGLDDITDFAPRYVTVTLDRDTPLSKVYDIDGQFTGAVEYRWTGEDMGYGARGRFAVPIPADAITWYSTGDGDPQPYTVRPLTIETEYLDYYYNRKTGARLDAFSGHPERVVFVDETGDGASYFQVRFTDAGLPLFYSQFVPVTSWWQELAPGFALAMMILTQGGATQWLGATILGAETAVAYPTLAQAVGRLAISTALSGGDVRSAATRFVSDIAGANVSDVLGSALDSAEIGAIAGAVTSAAIEGGDVSIAAAAALAKLGIKTMGDEFDFETDFGGVVDDGTGFDFGGVVIPEEWGTLADLGIDADAFAFSDWLANSEPMFDAAGASLDALTVDDGGNLFLADGYYVELSDAGYAGSFYADDLGNVRAPDNAILISADEAAGMSEDEMSARIYQTWEQSQGAVSPSQPPGPGRPESIPPPASQTKTPGILDAASVFDKLVTIAASIAGKIRSIKSGQYIPQYSAYPGGIPRVQAVGVPIPQPNGSTITNNGNGTQTIRYPDGRTDTIRTSYGAGSSGSLFGLSGNTLLIAGGVAVAALLIAKGNRK